MSLDKAIEYGKERRKKYRGSKRIDRTCRNHGGCDYCKGNRLYSTKKAMDSAKEQMKGESEFSLFDSLKTALEQAIEYEKGNLKECTVTVKGEE